jgi:FixJ family two-component response regulator
MNIAGPAEVVCLVDDDASIRKSIGRLLESDGFSVRPFAEPDDFLRYVADNPVPVAILDIWMASMTGIEVLGHLCARSPDTRVIFVTGYDDSAAETTVMQAGAFAFLLKPLDDGKFLSVVHRAFHVPLQRK